MTDLIALAHDPDWLVSMRALDCIEKLARAHPAWIAPHKRVLIGALADSDKWEIQLQIVRALPLFTWTHGERRRVVEILRRGVEQRQTFVKAWALDSYARLAEGDAVLVPVLRRYLKEFELSKRPALVARAKHIRARLAST